MKRTFTVNLNNQVFHIDDDAYELLNKYLHDVEERLSPEEKKEVMIDIESRVAELFIEKLQRTKTVITMEDVDAIIQIMGKPNDYEEDSYESESGQDTSKQSNKKRNRRKFYRDKDNVVFGGVAAGLAAFLGWDVIPIRIILVLMIFLGWGTLIPVYFVFWLIVPEAKTIAQKLEMQGEEVTAERIKEEVQNLKNYVESEQFRTSATSIGQRLGQVFMIIIKIIFGFIAFVMAAVGLIVVGALLLGLSIVVFEPGVWSDILSQFGFESSYRAALMVVSLLLVVGVPIFMLIYWAVRAIRPIKRKAGALPWVMLVLWIVGVFMSAGLAVNTLRQWNKGDFRFDGVYWSDNDEGRVDEVRELADFRAIKVSDAIKIRLTQDSLQSVVVNTQASFLPYVKTEVDENGVLHIYMEKLNLNNWVRVNIGANDIDAVSLSGAGMLKTNNKFRAETFNISMTGASQADVDLAVATDLMVDVSGASKLELEGYAYQLNADISGASKFDADDFTAKNAKLIGSGASKLSAKVTDSLWVDLSGASKFNSTVRPQYLDKQTSGASKIRIQ